MKTLKELTPNKYVAIATITEPNVEWEFCKVLVNGMVLI